MEKKIGFVWLGGIVFKAGTELAILDVAILGLSGVGEEFVKKPFEGDYDFTDNGLHLLTYNIKLVI